MLIMISGMIHHSPHMFRLVVAEEELAQCQAGID